jgi:hypothetical protein
MSAYPPPDDFLPIFNESEYGSSSSSLTQASGDLRYLKLTGGIESGLVTFNAGLATATISNGGAISVPNKTDTFTLNNAAQTVQNKTLQCSSNTSIASFTSTTITTSFQHNLAVGDVISFPYVGSMTGISIATNYTIDTVPSSTQFTLNGISSLGGTVNNAYYVLVTRATTNESSNGGLLKISDPTVPSNGLHFDLAGSTLPTVIRCTAAANALPVTIPSFGGTVATLNNSATFTGAKTFNANLLITRAGQTSSTACGLVSNPGSTAMTGANNYFYSSFNTPASSGSTTGTSSTVYIAGATSTAANNYALQIASGQVSLPLGTVASPSICFANNKTSGFYSSGANIINIASSGVNIAQVSNTGMTVSGITQSSTSVITPLIRPVSGNQINVAPATDLGTGTAIMLVSPSSTAWSTGGTGQLSLGDNNHYIKSINGQGIEMNSFNAIKLGTQGNGFRNLRFGSTSYAAPLAGGSSATVSVTFGVTLVSAPTIICSLTGASGSTFWTNCNVSASAVTASGFDATIYNIGGVVTSGTVNISYVAFNT